GVPADLGDSAYQLFTGVILRVRLAGEDQLHGPCLVGENPAQAVHVTQDQSGPLIGREAAGKSDGKRIWIQHLRRSLDLCLGGAAAHALVAHSTAGPCYKPLPAALMGPPQLLGRNRPDPAPDLALRRLLAPGGPQITVVELIELGGDPTPEMNSVGDMPDGDLLNRNAGPKRLPHSPADLSVQLADAIGA